jgi:hypothetical protein
METLQTSEELKQPALPHQEWKANEYMKAVFGYAGISATEVKPDTLDAIRNTLVDMIYEQIDIPEQLLKDLANAIVREINGDNQ